MSILQTLFGSITPTPAVAAPTPVPGAPENNTPAPAPVPVPAPESVDPIELLRKLPTMTAPTQKEEDKLPEFQALKTEDVFNQIKDVDFTKVITPEILTAIQAGGEGATTALLQAVNQMQRVSMTQAIMAADSLSRQNAALAETRSARTTPALLRSTLAADSIAAESWMSDPAVRPHAESYRQQYERQFPSATPEQISQAVAESLKTLAGHIKQSTTPPPSPATQATNWGKFANS